MNGPDRLQELLDQSVLTGLDFIYVYETQDRLDVFFLRPPDTLDTPLVNNLTAAQMRIEHTRDPQQPDITITGVAWDMVDGRTVLRLDVAGSITFAPYRLTIDDPRIDPYYNGLVFSFQANCETGLDCEPDETPPLPEDWVDFPVDYRARDFESFRRALLDFASQRYPDWSDRLAADVGVMLVEVMSALGDELAYYQDRIAREAYLETASQRGSLRRHARLVDYEIHNGLGASTWVDVTVTAGDSGVIPAGWDVLNVDGTLAYEIGTGLRDTSGYAVDAARNSFTPHLWDEDDTTLPAGTTQVYINLHHSAVLPLDDGLDPPGRWVLLQTNPADPAEPARRWPVRLIAVEDTADPLTVPSQITRLTWEQPTPWPLNLLELEVRGNLIPATAGLTLTAQFAAGAINDLPATIQRLGANGSAVHRFSLPGTDATLLTWLGEEPQTALPEVLLYEVEDMGGVWQPIAGRDWDWRRSLIGVASSFPNDRHFTLDDGTWGRVVGYWRDGVEVIHDDYRSGAGFTLRFGDGEFGLIPADDTVFEVKYRVGSGRATNIPRDTLVQLGAGLSFGVDAVTNPMAAINGTDPETPESVRQNAPEAFRAVTYRAVLPEDYAEAAERLPWVQRAGATARWTGSWLSMFTAPDPVGAVTITETQQRELYEQLDRFRLAGREAYPADPRYADLDIEVTICAQPFAYPGAVKEAVMEALEAFFSPDNFTFGQPLYRTALEAAAQNAYGVRAVERIMFRRWGRFDWREFTEYRYEVSLQEIVRLQNDPAYPERGSLSVIVEGGA